MKKGNKELLLGSILLVGFGLFTVLVAKVNRLPIGVEGSLVGFACINRWFHSLTGVHFSLYTITDWLGLVPIGVCLGFGVLGVYQWIGRKGLQKVDKQLFLLGFYYILVVTGYLVFETIPINFRPVLIAGVKEVSYPSSTTLLVMGVMPTLSFWATTHWKNKKCKRVATWFVSLFCLFMVGGRLFSGVHWLTDIIGALLFSGGLLYIYKGMVLRVSKEA